MSTNEHNGTPLPGSGNGRGSARGSDAGYASAAAVAGLAREVEALRRALERLREIPARVDELADLVARLAETTAASCARPAPAVAPSWLTLPADVRTAHVVLRELTGWMGAVYLRYPDAAAGLPECWLWHPDVVEELLWLMHAWLGAYRDQTATVQLAGDWHDRQRPGVVRRIRTAAGSCSLENHQPRDDHHPGGAPVVPLGEAAAELIGTWWAAGRDQPPPEPAEEHLAAVRRRPGWARR